MFPECLIVMSKAQTQFISPAEHNLLPESEVPHTPPSERRTVPRPEHPTITCNLKNVSSASQHASGTTATSPWSCWQRSTREHTTTSTHHTGFRTRERNTNQHQVSTLASSEMYAYNRVLVCTSLSTTTSLRLRDIRQPPTLSNCKSSTPRHTNTTSFELQVSDWKQVFDCERNTSKSSENV